MWKSVRCDHQRYKISNKEKHNSIPRESKMPSIKWVYRIVEEFAIDAYIYCSMFDVLSFQLNYYYCYFCVLEMSDVCSLHTASMLEYHYDFIGLLIISYVSIYTNVTNPICAACVLECVFASSTTV